MAWRVPSDSDVPFPQQVSDSDSYCSERTLPFANQHMGLKPISWQREDLYWDCAIYYKQNGCYPPEHPLTDNQKRSVRHKAKSIVEEDGKLYYINGQNRRREIIFSSEERVRILNQYHSSTADHLGWEKTWCVIRDIFYWRGLSDDVKKWVANCPVCQRQRMNKMPTLAGNNVLAFRVGRHAASTLYPQALKMHMPGRCGNAKPTKVMILRKPEQAMEVDSHERILPPLKVIPMSGENLLKDDLMVTAEMETNSARDVPIDPQMETVQLQPMDSFSAEGFKASFNIALAKGSVDVEIVKCVTLGPPEAGKTQLKSALVGKFDDSIESTPMSTKAEVVMQRYICEKTSWETLTQKRLLDFFHTTVKKHFVESTLATTLTSSVVVDTQPLAKSHQPLSCGNEAEKKEALLKQFSAIKKSVEIGLQESDSAEVRSLQKLRMIHFIDSGGQPAFFDIHPMIATSRAVYLLVYNMKEGLDAKPKMTYRKREFPTKELPNEKRSNLDLIKDSLLVLQNCKPKFAKMDGDLCHWFGESFGQSADVVPVLVVGSRKKVDRIAPESEKLAAGCGHLPTWSEVLDCTETGTKLFAVDSKDRDCDGVQSVRDIVKEAECTYHLPLPISWVLCQLIFWSANEDLHVLTYTDLQDLCLQEDLVANDAQFLAMVRTFHLLGIFSFPFFDQELTLGDEWKPDSHPVFTNPDALYKQVTKILDVAFRHLERTKMNVEAKRSLKELQSSGRLNIGTLSHLNIPDQLGSYTGFHSYLLELLVHWGLAARLPSKVSAEGADGAAKLECFIPSVLPAYEQRSFQLPPGCPIPRLAFTLKVSLADGRPCYHVPQGIFPHLVVNILSAGKQYHIQDNLDSYKCLFRDAAHFVVKPSFSGVKHSYSVVVTDDMDHISMSICPSHAEMKMSDRDCNQIVRDFHSAIEDAYKRIYSICANYPVILACHCPCDRIGKNHLAAILPHASIPGHYIQECLSAECPYWVQDCPEDIYAILNQATDLASVSIQKIPPTHKESPTAELKRTVLEGGSVTPVYKGLGTTTAISLPASTGITGSTITHPADIIRALQHKVDARWKHFGAFLYVEPTLMDVIERDSKQGATDCMLDLVTKWVTRYEGTGKSPRTWQTVVEAVRGSGCGNLAMEVAETHDVTLPRQ